MLFAGHLFIVGLSIPAVLALLPRRNSAAYTNSTSTSTLYSTITPRPSSHTCVTHCTVTEVPLKYQFWAKHDVNGTIKGPTDQTNSAGTATAVVTFFNGSTSAVAYPTPFWDYQYYYRWTGVIQNGSGTHSICVTAKQSLYTFGPTHPPYPTSTYPNSDDGFGLGYKLVGLDKQNKVSPGSIDAMFIETAFPDQLASLVYASCSQQAPILLPPFMLDSTTGLQIVTSLTPDSGMITQELLSAPTISTILSPDNLGALSSAAALTSNSGIFALSSATHLQVPSMPGPAATTVGDQPIAIDLPGDLIIGTQSLAPGEVITVARIPVSLGSSQSFIMIGTATEEIAVASAGGFLIGSQTLTPGGAVTISGIPIFISSSLSHNVEIEGSSKFPLILTTEANPLSFQTPGAISFAGQIYTMDSASAFVINGQTLTPGGAITISGTPISLPVDGSYVIEGTSTVAFITASQPPEAATIGDQIYTMNSASDFIIGGQTLTPGGVITTSGTPVSLAAIPTDIVFGTSTKGLGDLTISGLGGDRGPAPTAAVTSTGARPIEKYAARVIAVAAAGIVASVLAFV